MRLALSPRTERMLGRLPRANVVSALELALLALIAVQCARLVWTAVTPVGPVGDWRAVPTAAPAVSASVLDTFDPFFRLSAGPATATVTSLDLTLHGVREDRATGRGSAIIGLPDGEQRSFAVGEEVLPGVTLSAVGFDGITILRNGQPEQLFLDQPESAPAEGGSAAQPQGAPAAPPPPMVSVAASPVRLQPRMAGGKITGIVVQPGSNPQAMRETGLAPGDVLVAVDGQPVTSAAQIQELSGRSGEINVLVERGGRAIPLRVRF